MTQTAPATVPYAAYQREREGRIKAEREWHYWENEFYLQRKIRRAPVLQPIDKAILEECRHVEKWGTVKAPDGSTRANFTTIAKNLKSSPGTVASHAERLKKLGLIDIHEHQGPKDESDRKYVHVHEEKLPHLDKLTDPDKVVPQQGGDRFAYLCMKCDTEMEIRTVTRSRKKVMLRCPHCRHESTLEEDLEDVVEDTGWKPQNGHKAQKQLAFGDEMAATDEADDQQNQLAVHSVHTLPSDEQVSDDEGQKQVAFDASASIADNPDIPSPVATCNGLPPAELRALPIWCPRRGKVPYQTVGKAIPKAESDNPATWSTYEAAVAICEKSVREGWKYPFDGIGYMCDGSFVGIDLDHCRNKETGEIAEWAQRIIDRFPPTYIYITPSGEGLRILILAEKPGPRCKQGDTEIYQEDRFFTWTSMQLPGTPATIEPGQEALTSLYHETFPPQAPRREALPVFTPACPLEDDALLARARNAASGSLFTDLWEGRWVMILTDQGVRRYRSQSEADLALCGMLAYWGCDAEMMDRLFRRSGLYRPEKWDRAGRSGETYGEGTIRIALEGLAA